MEEEWRPVPIEAFKDFYLVSNHGRVKGRDILNPHMEDDGSFRVKLKYKHIAKDFYVHRLVALAFIPNDDPRRKVCVRHLDGDPGNNRADNLVWSEKNRKPDDKQFENN